MDRLRRNETLLTNVTTGATAPFFCPSVKIKVCRLKRKVYYSGMNEPTNNGFNADQQKHQDKRVALHVAILKDLAAQLPQEKYTEVSERLHELGDACYWLGVATQLRHTKTV